VSLLSTDYYSVAIAPASISLLHVGRGWKRRVLDKKILPATSGEELAVLGHLLAEAKPGRRLNIVLSNHYMRYKLLAVPANGLSEQEMQSTLDIAFRETYGEIADSWDKRFSDALTLNTSGEGDAVACAMDRSMLAAIKALSQKRHLKLHSLQPSLMAGFNRLHAVINPLPCCFVQVESGRLLIGLIRNRQWQSLRSISLAANLQPYELVSQLRSHLGREFLLAGWNAKDTAIYVDALPRLNLTALAADAGWQFKRVESVAIDGILPEQDADFYMALGAL